MEKFENAVITCNWLCILSVLKSVWRSVSLERYVDASINGSIILAYGHDGGGVVDEAVGATDANFRCNAVGKVYCAAKSGTLEIAVGLGLVDSRSGYFPMFSERMSVAKRQVALYAAAVSVRVCACGWVGIFPFFEFVEQAYGCKHKAVFGVHQSVARLQSSRYFEGHTTAACPL